MFDTIDTVVFDMGGVLLPLEKERCIRAFTELGFPQIEAMLDFYHPLEIFNLWERGEVVLEDVCEYIRQKSGLDLPSEKIRDAYFAFIDTISVEKLRAIERLKSSGVKCYLLSNTNATIFDRVREVEFRRDGGTVGNYMDKCYLSYEMGLLKPSHDIFRQMISDSGITPSRTLFIDDSARNIASAQELGFNVYQPLHHEDFIPIINQIRA